MNACIADSHAASYMLYITLKLPYIFYMCDFTIHITINYEHSYVAIYHHT